MKLSVIEAKLTGSWARNSAAIQQAWILKFASGFEKFPGLSRNGPLGWDDEIEEPYWTAGLLEILLMHQLIMDSPYRAL